MKKALIWLDVSYFPSVYFLFLLTTFVHDGYFVSEIKLRLSSTLEFPQAYSCDVCPPTWNSANEKLAQVTSFNNMYSKTTSDVFFYYCINWLQSKLGTVNSVLTDASTRRI